MRFIKVATFLFFVVALLIISCGDDAGPGSGGSGQNHDSDDDTMQDDDVADDDMAADDDVADDDTWAGGDMTCQEAYDYMYDNCGLRFLDGDDNIIDVSWLIQWCEDGEARYSDTFYDCINDNRGNCDEVEDCLIYALG